MPVQTIKICSKSIMFKNSKNDSYVRGTAHRHRKSGDLPRVTCLSQNSNSALEWYLSNPGAIN